jgi:chromosome segregation protein
VSEITLDEYTTEVNYWRTRLEVIKGGLDSSKKRSLELKNGLTSLLNSRQVLEARLKTLNNAREEINLEREKLKEIEIEVSNQIDRLNELIKPAESNLHDFETDMVELDKREQNARQTLVVVETHSSQVRNGLARRQEALDSLRRRIEEDFGLVQFEYVEDISGPTPLPLEGMVEQLPKIAILGPEIEESIKRQRAQLRRIGPVNPENLTEYNEVHQRYLFLTEQVEDLEAAETDVRKIIQELDLLMQKEFQNTFEQVAIIFKEYFTRLFGGGSARLILSNPDDLTDTGVDIEAKLPGRRTQGLSLLSGGERSLTAVALVFALLKVSPTPFCLLDEVDAMLDEANVHRFRDLLNELSRVTQFVVVTHNRNTVQAAEFIYGVTLGRDLASQVLSLRLDEVSKVVGDE